MADDNATHVLHMRRGFEASSERILDAWIDPAVAGRWLFTSPTSETHETEIGARVGSKWRITDRREGQDYTAIGEYLEIDRPRRLVFTVGMPQFSPEFARVTFEIAPTDSGCILCLTHERLPEAHLKATDSGWAKMFDALAAVLGPEGS